MSTSSSSTSPAAQGNPLPSARTMPRPPSQTDQQRQGRPSAARISSARQPTHSSQIPLRPSDTNISRRHAPQLPHPDTFSSPVHRDIAVAVSNQDGLAKSIDKAFTVYSERLRADLSDFRGLCTSLVVQEQQEARKWYSLCVKVMKERDLARQRLHLLATMDRDRNGHRSSNSPPPASPLSNQGDATKMAKRGREDGMRAEASSAHSRASSIDDRVILPLRLSPVHSPGSPGHMSLSPPPFSSVSPPLSSASSPPASASLPNSASSSTFHNNAIPSEQRPVKKRKSCDVSMHAQSQSLDFRESQRTPEGGVRVKVQSRTPSPLNLPIKPPFPTIQALLAEFSHVDLMYTPTKGSLVCRACLLEKSKAPSPSFEPKVFPMTASWDDLRDHCIKLHPEACADVARLHPAEIFELRRRLSL